MAYMLTFSEHETEILYSWEPTFSCYHQIYADWLREQRRIIAHVVQARQRSEFTPGLVREHFRRALLLHIVFRRLPEEEGKAEALPPPYDLAWVHYRLQNLDRGPFH